MSESVTVAISCYNYGHFLAEAVDSVLAQTMQASQVIVVDDGSTDDTAAVARAYGDRVQYVHQSNAGLAAARNLALALCTGRRIVFLDADDALEATYLQACSAALDVAAPDIAFAYTPVRYFGARVGANWVPVFRPWSLRLDNAVTAAAMLRVNAIGALQVRSDLPFWEDWDLYLSLMERGWRGVRVNQPLLRYRQHASMSVAMTPDRRRQMHENLMAFHPALFPMSVRLAVRASYRLEHLPAGRRFLHSVRRSLPRLMERLASTAALQYLTAAPR